MTPTLLGLCYAVKLAPDGDGSIATLQTFTLIELPLSEEFVVGKGYAKTWLVT
jgi:hypothetical protein